VRRVVPFALTSKTATGARGKYRKAHIPYLPGRNPECGPWWTVSLDQELTWPRA
jgi:hypothetical protein